jgi:hypothetical protein
MPLAVYSLSSPSTALTQTFEQQTYNTVHVLRIIWQRINQPFDIDLTLTDTPVVKPVSVVYRGGPHKLVVWASLTSLDVVRPPVVDTTSSGRRATFTVTNGDA